MARKNQLGANIIWFEIPADKPERAKKFYSKLFGWKITPMPGMKDYWHIDTAGLDQSPDGGMKKRGSTKQPITNYIHVKSVTRSIARVKQLGGKVRVPKTAVPGMGYFAVFADTENNTIAVWEMNDKAK